MMDNANVAGAILYRKKNEFLRDRLLNKGGDSSALARDSILLQSLDEPVSIDLYKALKNKNSKHDIVLQANDIIYIPEINPFVSVKGKVQSPLKIAFDKDHSELSYYIDKAGGLGIRPWRKRIYVTYANGRSKRTKNFCFLHFYPRIEEGCTITVPERPEGKDVSGNVVQALTTVLPIVVTYMLLK